MGDSAFEQDLDPFPPDHRFGANVKANAGRRPTDAPSRGGPTTKSSSPAPPAKAAKQPRRVRLKTAVHENDTLPAPSSPHPASVARQRRPVAHVGRRSASDEQGR